MLRKRFFYQSTVCVAVMSSSLLFVISICTSAFPNPHTQPASFFPAELVYISNLKPQKSASIEVAHLVSIFNNSFGHTVRSHMNKLNRLEWVIRSIINPSKKLRIKEKYLRLIPTIQLHDTSTMNGSQRKQYLIDIASISQPPQVILAVNQIGSKLLVDRLINHKGVMLRPLISDHFVLFLFISNNKWNGKRDFNVIAHALSLMPKSMVRRSFIAVKFKLIKLKIDTKVLDIIERAHNELEKYVNIIAAQLFSSNHRKQSRKKNVTQFEVKSINKIVNALSTLDNFISRVIVREIWTQFEVLLEEFRADMRRKHGTDSFPRLFCIDVIKNYDLVLKSNHPARTMNVLLLADMHCEVIKDTLIDELMVNMTAVSVPFVHGCNWKPKEIADLMIIMHYNNRTDMISDALQFIKTHQKRISLCFPVYHFWNLHAITFHGDDGVDMAEFIPHCILFLTFLLIIHIRYN